MRIKHKWYLVAIIGLLMHVCYTASAQNTPKPPKVYAKAYILLESTSQRVLLQNHATDRLPPASITKLMTAYVVYRAIDAGLISKTDMVRISQRVYETREGSRMFLEKGSQVSVENLLKGLVIQSGNDAAVALAEVVAGSEDNFVHLMNEEAKKLGLKNSHFVNVNGLTADDHYMSAQDIAMLARAIITEFPEHYKLYKQRTFTWNGIEQENRNTLLRLDGNVDGLKTGYTDAAGYCLVASATRGKMRLISVVLNTESAKARVFASKQLLDYGFSNFVMHTLYKPNQAITKAAVEDGELARVDVGVATTVRLPINKNGEKLSARLVLSDHLVAPVKRGQRIGYIDILSGKSVISRLPALSLMAVEPLGFFEGLWRSIVD